MSAPTVVVVIVHFGDVDVCLQCLESVRESSDVSLRIVVVDQNPVASERLCEARDVFYVHEPRNLGFAGGANLGYKNWRSANDVANGGGGCDVLAILNPDVELSVDCLAQLAKALSASPFGIVGPALEAKTAPGEPRRWWNVGSSISWPSARPRSLRFGEPIDAASATFAPRSSEPPFVESVDYICGAVMAVRPDLFESLGGLPEDYFLYFEDADFCRRAHRRGIGVAVVPSAHAWHVGGVAFLGREWQALYYQARNRLLFSARWSPGRVVGWFHRVAFRCQIGWRAGRDVLRGRRHHARAYGRRVFAFAYGEDRTVDLSVVIPVFNEEESLEELHARLSAVLSRLGLVAGYEILFVDDGSIDTSAQLLEVLTRQDEAVRSIAHANNLGQTHAVLRGLRESRGRFVVSLDADLQNPPEAIPEVYQSLLSGHDLVTTRRVGRQDPWPRRAASKVSNKLSSWVAGAPVADHGCMLCGYSRRLVDAMCAQPGRLFFIQALAFAYADNPAELPVEHFARRHGKSRFSFAQLLKLQFKALVSYRRARRLRKRRWKPVQ